jgi:hypothetical protein
MSSSNRQASLSPGERQRTKIRSSSRTPSNLIVHEEDTKHEKTSLSPTSKKQRSKGKKSKSPSSNRKGHSKRKKTSITISDSDSKQISQLNNSEQQDLSSHGFSTVPSEIFESKSNLHFFLN